MSVHTSWDNLTKSVVLWELAYFSENSKLFAFWPLELRAAECYNIHFVSFDQLPVAYITAYPTVH